MRQFAAAYGQELAGDVILIRQDQNDDDPARDTSTVENLAPFFEKGLPRP